MKPQKLLKLRSLALPGLLCVASALAFSQAPPVQPPRPLGTLPPGGSTQRPSLSCGQNRLTTIEQIQNGVSLLEIQQQETRAIACKVNPAVVEIVASGFGALPGQEYETALMATPEPLKGSGVILSSDGYIMTNRHVIRGAPKITVVLHTDGKPDEQIPAILKGQDANTDLALLKIDGKDLPFLEFGRAVRQGDTVFAFGSPHGVGISMTKGIISAPIRQVKEEDQLDYIQTDSAINPGNSGGALVDTSGRLVGINTFILSGSGGNEGLNFAIPSDVVQYIFRALKENGYVIRGTIGITTRNLTPELIRALKLPVQLGVYIDDVEPKGPADEAGIQGGDIVLSHDGIPLDGRLSQDLALELKRAISGKPKGQTIDLEVLQRQSQQRKKFTIVVDQNSAMTADETPQLSSDTVVAQLGVYVLQVGPGGASALGLRSTRGVMVAAKVQSMTAAATELENRDLIVEVGNRPVTTQGELQRALDNADPDNPVAIRLERDKKYMTVLVNLN